MIVISIFFISCTNNELLGKWKTNDRNTMFKTLEFNEKGSVLNGMIIKSKYDISEDKVIVTDKLGTGIIYNIIDNQTMSTTDILTGKKIIYKRIN